MDLVKARERARKKARKKTKPKGKTAKASQKAKAGLEAEVEEITGAGEQGAEREGPVAAAPLPGPPDEEPREVFMDEAFGEDLPPVAMIEEEGDEDTMLGGPETVLDDSRSSLEVPTRGHEEDDEIYWEVKKSPAPKQSKTEPEDRPPRDTVTATEAPAPPPAPSRSEPEPGPEEREALFDHEPAQPVAEGLEDNRVGRGPEQAPSRGLDGVELDGETNGLVWHSNRMAGEDDDFFSLVTEELYMREFGRQDEEGPGSQLQLLSFRLAQEIYAVRLTSIKQIIKLAPITTVPRSPDYVLGIISLRGTIIPVLDLRRRLNLAAREPTRKSRIVVVAEGQYTVGLIVDEVRQVVRISDAGLEPPPSVLGGVEAEYIEGIGRAGDKMIILLALEKIMVPVVAGAKTARLGAEMAAGMEESEIKMAIFNLDKQPYAIDIMKIKQIIRPLKITRLPKAPEFMEGVIDLRGVVIPVIDMRKRFGLEPLGEDHDTKVIIASVDRRIVGIIVDEVSEVISVPRAEIQPPPRVIRGVESEYLLGVCRYEDDILLILNLDEILTSEEKVTLSVLGESPARNQNRKGVE